MEDIRIQRKTFSLAITVSVPAANSVLILPADPLRTAILFTGHSANRIVYGFDSTVVVTAGLIVPANGLPFPMSIDQFGQLVTREWWAIASAGAQNITVFVSRLQES
jgi:hypothetical protein